MSRVALVTGGAKGIGREVALGLAARGWDVAIGYRTSADAAEAVRAQVEQAGQRGLAAAADVADPEQAAGLVRRVEDECGAIDALVHAAGPYHRVELLEETPAGWREMIDGNLGSLFLCARAVLPGMMARGWGRIVGFSMANADKLTAQPNVTAHYVAKVGVLALLRTLARIGAPRGVTANAVSPGYIDSGSAPAGELERAVAHIPAGRLGTTADAASAALYLLSDEAAYVNGAHLVVSGGWGI